MYRMIPWILCFGVPAVFLINGPPMPVVLQVAMVVMAAALCFISLAKLRNLADEVKDGGDHLLVRKGSAEERIPLSNVIGVGPSLRSRMTNGPLVLTVRLRSPCRFGLEFEFIPREASFPSNPLRNPIAEDLIRRVDDANRNLQQSR